ncbi:4'-phosphopantetheinyl transferase superfamily protein [Streptomyces sp. H27-C3]|uniref:4'-phosphopantetheinyl transferase superfamily protein n=1 Tax=Streptomyces sp. H27-C3 TaxID=3046305 RepID=UPI0024BA3717|nr:4'-phosphopantetheinyl transferase superfamily protein [Streptomyces sp. H27-C3]MDJ0464900.1 4'-phosphopantetheinyl transferase superfamily protein [Streptomyces sp. H27-C3]
MPARPVAPSAGGLGWANLGMDIVSAHRVRKLLAEHGEEFFTRMLGPGELADCRTSTGLDVLGLCGRIAAKEAAFKTLRVRNRFLPWLDIVIRRADGGWPLVELRRSAAVMAGDSGITGITVSISHDVEYAVAVAAPITGDTTGPGSRPEPTTHSPPLRGVLARSAVRSPLHIPLVHSTVRRPPMSDGLQQIKDWILKRHTDREDIATDLDLIENRLIDSLSFVEFVFLLEQLSGRSIEMETLEVDAIRTLGAIESNFFCAEVK